MTPNYLEHLTRCHDLLMPCSEKDGNIIKLKKKIITCLKNFSTVGIVSYRLAMLILVIGTMCFTSISGRASGTDEDEQEARTARRSTASNSPRQGPISTLADGAICGKGPVKWLNRPLCAATGLVATGCLAKLFHDCDQNTLEAVKSLNYTGLCPELDNLQGIAFGCSILKVLATIGPYSTVTQRENGNFTHPKLFASWLVRVVASLASCAMILKEVSSLEPESYSGIMTTTLAALGLSSVLAIGESVGITYN